MDQHLRINGSKDIRALIRPRNRRTQVLVVPFANGRWANLAMGKDCEAFHEHARLRCCYHLDDYLLVEHHETGGFGNKDGPGSWMRLAQGRHVGGSSSRLPSFEVMLRNVEGSL